MWNDRSFHRALIKYCWVVTYGTRQWLDDRGRIKDYKVYMTESQAKHHAAKHGAQASKEERR